MTGGIFRKDDTAPLLRAEQKPRLNWGRDVWIALIGCSHLNRILSDPKADHRDIVGAYFIVTLAAAILMFRMGRRIRQRCSHMPSVLGSVDHRERP
jgi:hypothetical protein